MLLQIDLVDGGTYLVVRFTVASVGLFKRTTIL